jgi:hypothetical protein
VKTLEKKWRKTINFEETLKHEKREQSPDVCHNVRFAHSSIHKIPDNSDSIKESAKSETKVFV